MYGLKDNVARKAGTIGKEENKEMEFWTQEEFQAFLECVADKPISYYAFEMLYWTGIREGKLLALTPADFNFEKKTLRINKSYQRLEGKDVITDPKTPKSNRTIVMPDFLAVEMENFISSLYGIKDGDRIFTISKKLSASRDGQRCKACRSEENTNSWITTLVHFIANQFRIFCIGNR